MLRFFRTRAPLIGLLLLAAFLVTLPGLRHPLPLLGLAVLVGAGARAVHRWQTAAAARAHAARDADGADAALDAAVARSAEAWDARHGPPDDAVAAPGAEEPDEAEPWRASLTDDDAWRRSVNRWPAADDD
jgi:hypothetical protein